KESLRVAGGLAEKVAPAPPPVPPEGNFAQTAASFGFGPVAGIAEAPTAQAPVLTFQELRDELQRVGSRIGELRRSRPLQTDRLTQENYNNLRAVYAAGMQDVDSLATATGGS